MPFSEYSPIGDGAVYAPIQDEFSGKRSSTEKWYYVISRHASFIFVRQSIFKACKKYAKKDVGDKNFSPDKTAYNYIGILCVLFGVFLYWCGVDGIVGICDGVFVT